MSMVPLGSGHLVKDTVFSIANLLIFLLSSILLSASDRLKRPTPPLFRPLSVIMIGSRSA
jgi:hypothetical protein